MVHRGTKKQEVFERVKDITLGKMLPYSPALTHPGKVPDPVLSDGLRCWPKTASNTKTQHSWLQARSAGNY